MKPKPPKPGTSAPLPPEVLEARRLKESLERELIFGMMKSYQFYRSIRDFVCPWIPEKSTHRMDFSIGRYNFLYPVIDAFYRRFDNKTVSPELFVPEPMLRNMLVDKVNGKGISLSIGEELVKELEDERPFVATLTLDSLTALSHGAAFKDWLQSRVTEQAAGLIQARKGLGELTLETMEQLVAEARRAASMAGTQESQFARPIGEFQIPPEDDGDCLIGPNRFFSREAIAGLVGQSGIGKSTLAMQLAICFAMGKETFGFKPLMSLKILIIQGENDDGDIAEMRDGAVAGLGLSDDEKAQVSAKVLCLRCNSATGKDFIQGPVRRNLQKFRPDLLIIDPALCYVGGDSREQKVVGEFLRTHLLPELQQAKCGCLLLHHTNKPPAQNSRNGTVNEDAYAEGGSAEFRNVARAVITLRPVGDGSLYELRVPKRGNRLGWTDDDGEPTDRKYLRHSSKRHQLFWESATETDVRNALAAAEDNKTEVIAEQVLACIARHVEIDQSELLAEVKVNGIGDKSCREAIKVLLNDSKILCTDVPRSGVRPGKRYSLLEKPKPQGGGA